MTTTNVARAQLHAEVWAEPMTTVAKRYGVSSNYLARICEQLKVPRPGRGYWQQRAAGIDVQPAGLPAAEPGDPIEWTRDGTQAATEPLPAEGTPRWRTPSARPKTHPVLLGARALFDEVRDGRDVQYVVPRKTKLVDIFVSKQTLDRALKVANDLFLFLEDRGHRVLLAPPRQYHRPACDVREGDKPAYDLSYDIGSWQPSTPTIAHVRGLAIGITLYETSEEVEVVLRDGKWVRAEPPKPSPATGRGRIPSVAYHHTSKHWLPTGRLAVRLSSADGVKWEDTRTETSGGELPKMFDAIAEACESAVPKIKALVEEEERRHQAQRAEWAEQQKRWALEEEERRRKEQQVAREKRLLSDLDGWRLARDIRAFVAEAKQMVSEADLKITAGGPLETSLEFALAYAEKIDPLAGLRVDIKRMVAEREQEGGTAETSGSPSET